MLVAPLLAEGRGRSLGGDVGRACWLRVIGVGGLRLRRLPVGRAAGSSSASPARAARRRSCSASRALHRASPCSRSRSVSRSPSARSSPASSSRSRTTRIRPSRVMLPFRDVFMSLFFVSIGMLLDFQLPCSRTRCGSSLLTLGVLLIKPVVAAGRRRSRRTASSQRGPRGSGARAGRRVLAGRGPGRRRGGAVRQRRVPDRAQHRSAEHDRSPRCSSRWRRGSPMRWRARRCARLERGGFSSARVGSGARVLRPRPDHRIRRHRPEPRPHRAPSEVPYAILELNARHGAARRPRQASPSTTATRPRRPSCATSTPTRPARSSS